MASADTASIASAAGIFRLQIAWVLELSERRRAPARRGTFSSRDRAFLLSCPLCPPSDIARDVVSSYVRGCSGAGELDDDVLLRLHPVPGQPGEVARLAAGSCRRRNGGRRRCSPVVTPGTSPCPASFIQSFYSCRLAGSFRHSEFVALRGAKCLPGCWIMRKFVESGGSTTRGCSVRRRRGLDFMVATELGRREKRTTGAVAHNFCDYGMKAWRIDGD